MPETRLITILPMRTRHHIGKMGLERHGYKSRERAIQYGNSNDHYAMLQLYGGFEGVTNIVQQIPDLSPKELGMFPFQHEKNTMHLRISNKREMNYFPFVNLSLSIS